MLVKDFYDLKDSFNKMVELSGCAGGPGGDQDVGLLLSQITRKYEEAKASGALTLGDIDIDEIPVWISDPKNGWFTLMFMRYAVTFFFASMY
jgi:hypothetical protein